MVRRLLLLAMAALVGFACSFGVGAWWAMHTDSVVASSSSSASALEPLLELKSVESEEPSASPSPLAAADESPQPESSKVSKTLWRQMKYEAWRKGYLKPDPFPLMNEAATLESFKKSVVDRNRGAEQGPAAKAILSDVRVHRPPKQEVIWSNTQDADLRQAQYGVWIAPHKLRDSNVTAESIKEQDTPSQPPLDVEHAIYLPMQTCITNYWHAVAEIAIPILSSLCRHDWIRCSGNETFQPNSKIVWKIKRKPTIFLEMPPNYGNFWGKRNSGCAAMWHEFAGFRPSASQVKARELDEEVELDDRDPETFDPALSVAKESVNDPDKPSFQFQWRVQADNTFQLESLVRRHNSSSRDATSARRFQGPAFWMLRELVDMDRVYVVGVTRHFTMVRFPHAVIPPMRIRHLVYGSDYVCAPDTASEVYPFFVGESHIPFCGKVFDAFRALYRIPPSSPLRKRFAPPKVPRARQRCTNGLLKEDAAVNVAKVTDESAVGESSSISPAHSFSDARFASFDQNRSLDLFGSFARAGYIPFGEIPQDAGKTVLDFLDHDPLTPCRIHQRPINVLFMERRLERNGRRVRHYYKSLMPNLISLFNKFVAANPSVCIRLFHAAFSDPPVAEQRRIVADTDILLSARGASTIYAQMLQPGAAFISLSGTGKHQNVQKENDNFPWWPFSVYREDIFLRFVVCGGVTPWGLRSINSAQNCAARINYCDYKCSPALVSDAMLEVLELVATGATPERSPQPVVDSSADGWPSLRFPITTRPSPKIINYDFRNRRQCRLKTRPD